MYVLYVHIYIYIWMCQLIIFIPFYDSISWPAEAQKALHSSRGISMELLLVDGGAQEASMGFRGFEV